MGNSLSYPESMKDVPNQLKDNQYVKMVLDNGTVYYFQKRTIGTMLGNSIRQNFSLESFALHRVGLGQFSNMMHTNTGHFYATKTKPFASKDALVTTVDSTELKLYIKLFAIEQRIHLETTDENKVKTQHATFTVETQELNKEEKGTTSFGKRKAILKKLYIDLKRVNSF
jgi:hypothetical protein